MFEFARVFSLSLPSLQPCKRDREEGMQGGRGSWKEGRDAERQGGRLKVRRLRGKEMTGREAEREGGCEGGVQGGRQGMCLPIFKHTGLSSLNALFNDHKRKLRPGVLDQQSHGPEEFMKETLAFLSHDSSRRSLSNDGQDRPM